jgi:hypothetical protein
MTTRITPPLVAALLILAALPAWNAAPALAKCSSSASRGGSVAGSPGAAGERVPARRASQATRCGNAGAAAPGKTVTVNGSAGNPDAPVTGGPDIAPGDYRPLPAVPGSPSGIEPARMAVDIAQPAAERVPAPQAARQGAWWLAAAAVALAGLALATPRVVRALRTRR